MSKTRLISTLTAGLALLAAACWFVTAAFPLAAEPQMVADGAGVTVEMNSAQLMHRSPVRYPSDAFAKGVEGKVVAQARLAADGTVIDATVVSGPDELRRVVLESVLSWHFAKELGGSTQTVTVNFQKVPAGDRQELLRSVITMPAAPPVTTSNPSTIKTINVMGLSDQARNDLLASLPLHDGDIVTPEGLAKFEAAVHAFDEHLRVSRGRSQDGSTTLTVMTTAGTTFTVTQGVNGGVLGSIVTSTQTLPPPPPSPNSTQSNGTQRQVIGGNVFAANLIYGPKPEYPALARQARISGVVHLHAFISADGYVQSLQVIPPAHPLLAPAAVEAVKQWRYKQTMLNGQAVEVETTIDVSFMLAEEPR